MVYTDRDSIFAVPPRPGQSKQQLRPADPLTQLARDRLYPGILAASQRAYWADSAAAFIAAIYHCCARLRCLSNA